MVLGEGSTVSRVDACKSLGLFQHEVDNASRKVMPRIAIVVLCDGDLMRGTSVNLEFRQFVARAVD